MHFFTNNLEDKMRMLDRYNFCYKILILFLCLYTLVGVNSPTLAQALSGDSYFRFGILTELIALRFSDPHPFKQMTGDDAFDETLSNPSLGLDFGFQVNGQENNEIQAIFRPLPPFSIEYVSPLDLLFFDGGVSFEYYHTAYTMKDNIAVTDKLKSKIPFINMQIYFDYFKANLFFSHPRDDFAIFTGIGIGIIEGAYEGGFRAREENDFISSRKTIQFSAIPATIRQIGIDLNGDIFDWRFELIQLVKTEVITNNVFDGDPITPDAQSSIFFGGIIIRVGLLFHF